MSRLPSILLSINRLPSILLSITSRETDDVRCSGVVAFI